MRLIILYLLLLSLAVAKPIVNIHSDDSTITDFKLSYFIDYSSKLKFEDIESMNFKEGKNRDSLGADVKDVWIKIKLFNSTTKEQTLFLHQDLAYTFFSMEYFEVDSNNTLINQQSITPFGANAKEELNGSDALYKFILYPQKTKTIYIHQTTPAYHFYNYSLFNEKESISYLIYEKVDAVLLVGLLLALALYNFLIFLSSRYKEYLYYTLYLVSSSLWIFYMYGSMAHYLHIYGETSFRFNFGLMFNPIFLALFIQAIFNTKTEYKREHKFLNSIILVLLSNFIFALVNFNQALQILSLTLNYSMFVFLGIAISIYLKGNKVIKIFLFAHIFYLVFNIYGLLFYMGMVDSTYISSHGVGIGIAIEALLLSYLVSYKFKIIEREKEQERLSKLEAIKEQKRSQQNNQQLQSLLKERELLLREVLHRVKNNFHMIIGILWIQGNKYKDKEPFHELINKIKSMAKINDYLYKSENLTKIKIDHYLGDIIQLASSLANKKNLKLDVNIAKIEVSFDTAMSLGFILNELLTNSIKHNHDLEEILIQITLKKDKEIYSLVVHDNGKEFNQDNENQGIGLMLIRDFSLKLKNSHHKFSFDQGVSFYLGFEVLEES